jgi:hypothetical protein
MSSREKQDEEQDCGADGKGAPRALKSRGRSLEITGLGVVISLILSFWSLVTDGTLPLSQYLVFVSFLLVSAGGMVWRLWKLDPRRTATLPPSLEPGLYRVTFGDRSSRW